MEYKVVVPDMNSVNPEETLEFPATVVLRKGEGLIALNGANTIYEASQVLDETVLRKGEPIDIGDLPVYHSLAERSEIQAQLLEMLLLEG